LLLALFSVPVGAPLAGATEPGVIDHVDFSVAPRLQGVGGPVTATARIFVGTDPHRNLFVNDLRVEIAFGSGLNLTEGANPVEVAAVEVPPTVNLYVITYSWLLSTTAVGVQNLSLRVTSAAAGGDNRSANVTVREGVVLGMTALTPPAPTTQTALRFRVEVSSGYDDADLPLNVTLFVYGNSIMVAPASANGSRLRLSTGEVVSGVRLRMEGENGSYAYTVPAQPRGTLIYWVLVETPYNNVTSEPTRVFIADPNVSAAVSGGALAAVVGAALAAAGAIVYDVWGRKPATGSLHNSPERIRLSLALLAVGITLFALSALLGSIAGLWRWFGYL
jgi:hypothetical protein